MLLCHYPAGSASAAGLFGTVDPLWCVKLSMMGYLCELSNPLMNWRWWLLKTLEEHSIQFSIVNVLLVLSFALRVVLLGWLLYVVILPMAATFVEVRCSVLLGCLCFLLLGIILRFVCFFCHPLLRLCLLCPRGCAHLEHASQAKQVFLYSLIVLGHTVILLLSVYWLKVLCKGGLKSLLTFKKPSEPRNGKFTFGTDMGRSAKGKEKDGKKQQ